jgi:fructokinase
LGTPARFDLAWRSHSIGQTGHAPRLVDDLVGAPMTPDHSMASARCIVFGEALVDAFHDSLVPGGAPFNVACHLAGLGFHPRLISRIGNDEAAQKLRVMAQRVNLDLSTVQVDRLRGTGRVNVLEGPHGHVFQIDRDQAYDHIDAEDALSNALDYTALDDARNASTWLYFGTLALRSADNRASLAAVRRSVKHRAFVDLNWRAAGTTCEQALAAMDNIAVLKVSAEELAQVLRWLGHSNARAGSMPSMGEFREEQQALMLALGLDDLLVTYGADGAAAWAASGICAARVPAVAVSVLQDTVGAGDAFSAMALACLMQGLSIEQLLSRAVAFAAAVCGERGALPQRAHFYDAWQLTPPVHEVSRRHA